MVHDVIHAFNQKGLAALDPQAGGRPRLISDEDVQVIMTTAATRPENLGLPFMHWSLRMPAACLAARPARPARPVRIGREGLRQILHAGQISFQQTRIWKESTDPDKDAKLDRIKHLTVALPDRCFALDQFGPLSIRLLHGTAWARQGKPGRQSVTYHRTRGIGYFNGCHPLGEDRLCGITRTLKGGDHTPAALMSIRAGRPGGAPIYVIMDSLSTNKTLTIRAWAATHKARLCFTSTSAWEANPIEAQFGPLAHLIWTTKTTRTPWCWPVHGLRS